MAQVPATSYESTSLGDVAEFTVPFPFLSREEVFVTVDDAAVPFTWINDGLIQLSIIPELGAIVRRYRNTAAFVPLHQFSQGVPFLPRYVDRDFKQTLYAVQESVNDTAGTAAQALATAEESLVLVQDAFNILGERTQYMDLGPYATGLEFQTTSQVFSYLGEFYAPGPAITLPYTTTGAGAGEIANFRSVGDAVLRSDLANWSVNKGSALLARGAQVVDSVASLRQLLKTSASINAIVTGYYAAGDGGGGEYYYDPADTTTADNGGSVIVAADGGRWKLVETVSINVLQFGAVGDGTADDSAAFQAALNSVGNGTRRVLAPGGRFYRLSSSITVPSGVELSGETNSIPDEYSSSQPVPPSSLLLEGSGVTINLVIASALNALTITKYGMVFPQNAAAVATWSGIAITAPNNGCSISNCVILGFALGINATNHSRLRVSNTLIDCTNGIYNSGSYDISYFNKVHIWPYASIDAPGGEAALTRAGYGIKLENVADWAKLTDCFVYAHYVGFQFNNVNSVTAVSCAADGITGALLDSIGFLVEGTSGAIRLVAPQAAAQYVGIRLNSSGPVSITSPNIWACPQHGVLVSSAGGFDIVSGFMEGPGAGVTIDNATVAGTLTGIRFGPSVFQPISMVTASPNVRVRDCRQPGGTLPIETLAFTAPTIASAGTLVLKPSHDAQVVTGTTTIGALSPMGCQVGRLVALHFPSGLTMTHSASLFLRGASNATVPAGGLMTFWYFGNGVWREASRNF